MEIIFASNCAKYFANFRASFHILDILMFASFSAQSSINQSSLLLEFEGNGYLPPTVFVLLDRSYISCNVYDFIASYDPV